MYGPSIAGEGAAQSAASGAGEDILLSVEQATDLGVRALRAVGIAAEQAPVIAAHLIDAALCGYRFAGLPRILTINEDARTHQPRTPVKVVHETEVSALMDGGNNLGYFAVFQAMRTAVEKARRSRIAIVGLYNSHLSGRSAYYLEHVARAGFVGLQFAAGPPMALPFGGAKPAFGTNPVAFAFPRGEKNPFIVDMGTAAMMRGEIILRSRIGAKLPEGIAVDGAGQPTTDPREALKGGMFAFGGHRGSALSFGIQSLCLLAGAARPRGQVQDFRFVFIVVDPEVMMPRAEFESAVDELIENVRKVPPLKPGEPVRIPSERAFQEREERRRTGIPVAPEVHRALLDLAARG